MKIIDVSSYQGNIDFAKVKNDGVKGVVHRTICKYNALDICFKSNVKKMDEVGLPYGGYVYVYSPTAESAKITADCVYKAIKDTSCKFIAIDLEYSFLRKISPKLFEEIVAEFSKMPIETIIYCNYDWYKNVLTSTMKQNELWIARYPKKDNGTMRINLKPNINGGLIMWQYTSKGSVDGIKGNVDINYCYSPQIFGYPSEYNSHTMPPAGTILRRYKINNPDYVKWVQYELCLKSSKIAIDGIYGKETELAVKIYQKMNGLRVDGIVGINTVTKLAGL